MDNLNKENFFDALQQKHPAGMAIFCNWIDGYKAGVNWHAIVKEWVKFHDLPYPMQAGIMIEFFKQRHPDGKAPQTTDIEAVKEFFKYTIIYVLEGVEIEA